MTERERPPEPGKKSLIDAIDKTFSKVGTGGLNPSVPLFFEDHPNNQRIPERKLTIKERLLERPYSAAEAFIYAYRIENNIVKPIKPEYAQGFDTAYMKIVKDPAVLPIIFSNHTGHADVASIAAVTKHLTELAKKVRLPDRQFLGYMLTIAASLDSGDQNLFMQQMAKQTNIRLKKWDLSLAGKVRKKDEVEYSMDRVGINHDYAVIRKAIIAGGSERIADGLAYFIEGTVEGGRRIKEGENIGQTNGMQKIDFSQFHHTILGAQKNAKRKVLLIFISCDHGYEVIDPDTKMLEPTEKAKKIAGRFRQPRESLLTVKVGMPIFFDDLEQLIREKKQRDITHEDLGEESGIRIAQGLPDNLKGYYANH